MSSDCIQLVVVAVTLLLSDVACHNTHVTETIRYGKMRLTKSQISEIVDRHNILRSLEGAADMKLMVWNTNLASLAANWTAGCYWAHPNKRIHKEYKGI